MSAIGKVIVTLAKGFKKPTSKAITKQFGQEASKFASTWRLHPQTAQVLGQTVKKTAEEAIGQAYSAGARSAAVITGGIGTVTTLSAVGYGLHEKNRADNAEIANENLQNVEQELVAANEELRKRQEELEKVKQEAQEAKNKLKEQEEAKKEPVEYTVKKGDCFWNIAKNFLIDEVHKNEQDYKPSDKEILELAKKFMKDNNYHLGADSYDSEPPLYPGDKLNLAA